MNRYSAVRRMRLPVAACLCVLVVLELAAKAGRFLVIDAPRGSDLILVLAGETKWRPRRALQLLDRRYGRSMLLDVPTNSTVYEFTQVQLAQKYVQDLPQTAAVSICPINGLSTRDESKDVAECLARQNVKSVLIVTSDFHTRRALGIFRHELPQYEFSVAAARDEEQFDVLWWRHRQWAKIFANEWLRLIWWESIDRWL